MAAKTPKRAILDALEDLEKTELDKFCSTLLDRREEPRIRRNAIENKSIIEIADKIVKTFTEDNAVEVTVTILKKINCNNVAQELEKVMEKAVNLMDIIPITPEKTMIKPKIPEKPVNPVVQPKISVTRPFPSRAQYSGSTSGFPSMGRKAARPPGISPTKHRLMYDPKVRLKSKLKTIQDNRNKYNEFEQTYKEVSLHNKNQVEITEKQIRAEIEKLHQFLREAEEERVSALKEEEKQKAEIVTREMKNIQEQISSLSDQMSEIEQELQKPSPSLFRQYTLLEPQLVSGVLIDVAKHLGNLTYTVCGEIKKKVMFSPVILDPNTANGYLSLSEDLTSVRDTETMLQLPDNPERFTMYPSVLGSEGFSSGKHSWEVEVGDHPRWNIGYVKKSVNRKGDKSVTPKDGVWCLCRHSMKYTNGVEYISVQRHPQRIRVQLDYDKGEVSFYDTEDMTHIYTHRQCIFREKLYPYLNYEQADAETAETTSIKVCKVE